MLKDEWLAVESLSEVITRLRKDGITNRESYRDWKKNHTDFLRKAFWFKDSWPVPDASSLVQPFFHPSEPFIGFNYTPLAHNTLFKFPRGWTVPLRLCRGIIFDTSGELIAKPFPKFFNYGEHPETSNVKLFSKPFEMSEKFDGHLGIIFKYEGRFYVTTRGSFVSRTSKLATEMLENISVKHDWSNVFESNDASIDSRTTILVEIIHPETRVLTNYGHAKKFVLIGACDCATLADYSATDLVSIGKSLSLEVSKCRAGGKLSKVLSEMKDQKVHNKEGYVVRLSNDTRVKFKFERYIGKMVAEKLSYAYIMKRMISSNLEKMIETLQEELYAEAEAMVKKIKKVLRMKGTIKEKRQYLYDLVSKKESTPYYRSICREFLKKNKIK
mgnify:CR=1 FL=1